MYQQVIDPLTKQIDANVIWFSYTMTINGKESTIIKCIPNNLQNSDWIKYQEWLKAGNTPQPPAAVAQ